MPTIAINGQPNVNQLGGWVNPTPPTPDAVWCYASRPVARAASDGTRPMFVTGLSEFVSGYGGSRSVFLFCSDAAGVHKVSDTFTVAAGEGSAPTGMKVLQSVAGHANSNGGDFQVGMFVNGAVRPGKASAPGRTVFPGTTSFFQNATLAGYILYAEAPTAPFLDRIVPSADGKSAIIHWVAPSEHGGYSVNGYYLQRAVNAAFSSGKAFVIDTASPAQMTGLIPGETYYYRITAQNAVTDAYGLAGGPWSRTLSMTQPLSTRRNGKISNGSAYVDTIGRISNGSAYVDLKMKISNGSAWVDNP